MEKYVHLLSSTNPLEIDQVILALKKENIKSFVKGEMSLGAGNVELTGIQGASITVPRDNLKQAKDVLIHLGLDTSIKEKSDSNYALILTLMALAAIGIIIFTMFKYV